MDSFTLTARLFVNGERIRQLAGSPAQTLMGLVESGEAGVTAAELGIAVSELRADCSDLKRRYGLDIRQRHTRSPSGWTPRFGLISPVEILAIDGEAGAA